MNCILDSCSKCSNSKFEFDYLQEIQLAKYYATPEEKRKDIELNPYNIMRVAIENCRPLMSLQKVKVGSVTYYVPTPITETR